MSDGSRFFHAVASTTMLILVATFDSFAAAKMRCFLVQQHVYSTSDPLHRLLRVSLTERSLSEQSRLSVDRVVDAQLNVTLFPVAPGNTERTLPERFVSVDRGGRFLVMGTGAFLQLRRQAPSDVLVRTVVSTEQSNELLFGRANAAFNFRVSSIYTTKDRALRFCVHQLAYSPGLEAGSSFPFASTIRTDDDLAQRTLSQTDLRCNLLSTATTAGAVTLATFRLPTLQALYSLVLENVETTTTTTVRVHPLLEEESLPTVSFELADVDDVVVASQAQTLPLDEFTRDRNALFETTELWCLYLYAGDRIVAAVWTVSHVSLSALFVTKAVVAPSPETGPSRFVTSLHYIRHTDSSFRQVEALLVDDRLFDGLRRTVTAGFRRLGTDVLLVCQRPKCAVCSTSANVASSSVIDRSLFHDCRDKLRSSLNVSNDRLYFDVLLDHTSTDVASSFGSLVYHPSLLASGNTWHEMNCDRLDVLLATQFPSSSCDERNGPCFVDNRDYVRGFFTFIGLWLMSFLLVHLATLLLIV